MQYFALAYTKLSYDIDVKDAFDIIACGVWQMSD